MFLLLRLKERKISPDQKNRNHVASIHGSSIVLEGIRTVLFFYEDILHKNKTPKYLNTLKTHNKEHSLGKKCPDKIADKKDNQ